MKNLIQRCAPVVLMVLLVSANAADDFQPHPSHQPPPPPAAPPPPPAAPKVPPPKAVKMVPPEYPDRARRFNATSTIRVFIHVKPNGSVAEVDAQNGNPVFVDSVKRAISKWKFEKRDEPSIVRFAVPFKLTGNGEIATDTAVRKLVRAPRSADEAGNKLEPGFAYVRVIIDSVGKVTDRFFTSAEPASFEASANAIIAKLEFAPVGAEDPPQPNGTINYLLVDYASDGVIRIQQRSGEPGN